MRVVILALRLCFCVSDARAKIGTIGSEYAKRSGTVQSLEAALSAAVRPKRTFTERLSRIHKQIHSFRVSAERDGENTILSAVHVCDEVLGNDFGVHFATAKPTQKPWTAAKHRSKQVKRQL